MDDLFPEAFQVRQPGGEILRQVVELAGHVCQDLGESDTGLFGRLPLILPRLKVYPHAFFLGHCHFCTPFQRRGAPERRGEPNRYALETSIEDAAADKLSWRSMLHPRPFFHSFTYPYAFSFS